MGDTIQLQNAGHSIYSKERDMLSKSQLQRWKYLWGCRGVKKQFFLDIKAIVNLEDTPHNLIFNWDQTAINYVLVSNWTMAKQGSKKVKIAGVDDKTDYCGAGWNSYQRALPLQLIYQGKTKQCLPRVMLPDDWLISFTPNR